MENSISLDLSLAYEVLRIRRIEEAIAQRYPEQEMRCPVHLSIGQEAVAVGACKPLRSSDYVFSAHRAHAHYLAKGGSLKRMIAELYGKATGCTGGRGGSMHLVDREVGFLGSTPIVGGSLPLAVGTALAEPDKVTVAFFGEGATEEGVFAESLNFASLKQLSILFVCENNFYSVNTPLGPRQGERRSRAQIARAHGMPALQGDGNDAWSVQILCEQAVERARKGLGPTYLEFETYRWLEHCGPYEDGHLGCRDPDEIAHWKTLCPLALLLNEVPDAQLDRWEKEISKEIITAFEEALAAPFPRPEVLYDGVYAP